jgi:hypothetical protein
LACITIISCRSSQTSESRISFKRSGIQCSEDTCHTRIWQRHILCQDSSMNEQWVRYLKKIILPELWITNCFCLHFSKNCLTTKTSRLLGGSPLTEGRCGHYRAVDRRRLCLQDTLRQISYIPFTHEISFLASALLDTYGITFAIGAPPINDRLD